MTTDAGYFSHLYDIARALNKEYSLHSALRIALERTVHLLELETGWIWLMDGDKSVYLAASHNLPPALKDHPERLSGRCYCIERYLSNSIEKARNISEIACTRLKNINAGTLDLKYHATIPINLDDEKVGLINLVSKESQELNENQLSFLNTVSELIGIAIQRTRAQDACFSMRKNSVSAVDIVKRVFHPRLQSARETLGQAKLLAAESKTRNSIDRIEASLHELEQLNKQLTQLLLESEHTPGSSRTDTPGLNLPTTPLTKREIELLALVKKGYTNKHIGETLFISERTVKFHITSILSKLAARTRTEAVDIALKRGYLSF